MSRPLEVMPEHYPEETDHDRSIRLLREIDQETVKQRLSMTYRDVLDALDTATEPEVSDIEYAVRHKTDSDLGACISQVLDRYCRRVAEREVDRRS